MDGEILKKLAKFKVLVKRTLHQNVEVSSIVNDKTYALGVLSEAENSDSEDLILLALELKDALGLLAKVPAAPTEEPKTQTATPPTPDSKGSGKYMFGARG